MDGECGAYGEEYKSKWVFLGGGPGYAGMGLDGRILLKPVLNN